MKSKQLACVVFVGVIAVYAATWLLMPSVSLLHDEYRAVEREASEQMERARRLLQRYSFSMARASAQVDRLDAVGVETGEADALSEDDYQRIHEQLWADFHPTDWGDVSREARATYGNIPGQIRDGVSATRVLVAANERWLDEAMDAVDLALSVTRGNASSNDHAEAVRLKGAIIYQQGVAAWLKARDARRLATPIRSRLAHLASEANEHRSALDRVAESGIEAKIAELYVARTEDKKKMQATAKRLADADREIARIEAELASAQERADRAEEAMGRLQDQGADLSRPDGAERFTEAFLAYDADYRAAQREIQALQVGALPHAHIGPTEDFLRGNYLENGSSTELTVRPGLKQFQDDRVVTSRTLDLQRRSFGELEQDIERLEGMKDVFQAAQDDARAAQKALMPAAEEVLAELLDVESEATALEDRALTLFDDAARVSEQAVRYAQQRIRDASRKAQLVASEARSRSAFDLPSKSGWMAGYVEAQVADARIAKAWVLYDRFGAHKQNADLFSTLGDRLKLEDMDEAAEREAADEARVEATEAVESAMKTLKSAHNGTSRHWTLVAQAGGAVYLLALLGDESYAADALESYRLAIQGREDERAAEVYAQRIAQLESK